MIDSQQQEARLMQEEKLKAEADRLEAEQRFEAEQNALNRENNIHVAELRAAVAMGNVDFDQNQQSDYLDTVKYLDGQRTVQESQSLSRQKESNKLNSDREKNALKRGEIRSRERIADKQVKVATINKNRFDKPSAAKDKK